MDIDLEAEILKIQKEKNFYNNDINYKDLVNLNFELTKKSYNSTRQRGLKWQRSVREELPKV